MPPVGVTGRFIASLRYLLASALAAMLTAAVWATDDPFADFEPVTDAMLQHPADGDWLMWRRTLDAWGYSPLDQIDRDNVDKIRVAWSRALPEGLMEATPLVYNGVMYVPMPDDVIQALDATTGDLLWEYRRQSAPGGRLPVKRSIAIWKDRLILLTRDNYIAAIDARSGTLIWETPIRDPTGGSQTSGPIVANGKAISGRNCGNSEASGKPETCFIAAHDLETGREVWRTYTIPKPGTPGDDTWAGVPLEKRRHVGTWITPSYDPDLNLIYIGTSVTSPYSKFYLTTPEHLDDEFLYQTSTLALNGDTGEIVWHQQHLRDHWDLDHVFERYLVDTVVAPNPNEVRWINPKVTPGERRRVVTGIPGKTGIFYSIDRATGEFLWARETVFQNVIADIDLVTGRATIPVAQIPTAVGQRFTVCPSITGGKDWPAGAYSPLTNAIYYPLANLCQNTVTGEDDFLIRDRLLSPGEETVGTIRGINVETGKEIWRHDNRAAVTSLLATGGGLVFGGDLDRRFRAFDQKSGDVLWEHIMPAQVGGFPISYEVDGRQYVAVPVGSMLISGSLLQVTPELRPVSGGNAVVAFALPDD